MKKHNNIDYKNKINIPEDQLLKLDNQICFALYVLSKEVIKKYKPLLSPLDLTYTGYITMLALWEKDNITVKSLGEKLYLDSGTLTPLLKKLESKELLIRRRSPEDERNVHISLTEKGKNLKKEAINIPKKLLCSTNFPNNSAKELLKTLHKYMPRNKK